MENFSVGQVVTIKRSDGHLQTAVVHKINEQKNLITVEWFEEGRAKGKEIELGALLKLNAELLTKQSKKPSIVTFDSAGNNVYDTRSLSPLINCTTQPQQSTRETGGRSAAYPTGRTNNLFRSSSSSRSIGKLRKHGLYMGSDIGKKNRVLRRIPHSEIMERETLVLTSNLVDPLRKTDDFITPTDEQDHRVAVCVRKRPLNRKEATRRQFDIISVPEDDTIVVHEPRRKFSFSKSVDNHKFHFDYVFDVHWDNEMVYECTAKPLVEHILDGGMGTCFAFGQAGSGKTHTMIGPYQGRTQNCQNGICAMAAVDVFESLHTPPYHMLHLRMFISFFEIRGDKVFDLLSDKRQVVVREDDMQRLQLVGLTGKPVNEVKDVLKIIQNGSRSRTFIHTSANSNSSRSHAVFQIVLRPSDYKQVHGKCSFIDLAGTDRRIDIFSTDRINRLEGVEINKALLALKECIRALGRQAGYLPFLGSTLTKVLCESFFAEKSKTCMIAMISPGKRCCEHTLNTLRYAERVIKLVAKELYKETDIQSEQIEQVDEVVEMAHVAEEPLEPEEPEEAEEPEERELSSLSWSSSSNDLKEIADKAVDYHRAMNDALAQYIPESLRLYKMANSTTYDPEAYCKKGEEVVLHLAEAVVGCLDTFSDFRDKLEEEKRK